jgi:predicted dehydrogenase
MAKNELRLDALTTRRVPFADALSIYQTLTTDAKDIGIVLEYPGAGEESRRDGHASPVVSGQSSVVSGQSPDGAAWGIEPSAALSRGAGRIASPVGRLDVIGAGNFARTMLLPHLKEKLAFGTIVNQTALSARHVQTKFAFEKAATDAGELLKQADSRAAVLIATRHHLHAPLVKAALQQGRHIFVEKPLCLPLDELREIDAAYGSSQGTVQVGFNRRFAPASQELKRLLSASPGPKSASFRVNAGKLDPQHWYANHAESGGRVLGEACHFLDYFCYLFDSDPVRVFAQTTWPASGRQPYPDSVAAQVEFADGSTGQLLYSGEGDAKYPKEMCTVYAAGLVGEITNYQELVLYRGRQKKNLRFTSKGHAEQMAAWQDFLRGTSDHPFPYLQARRSMLLTFAVLESIQRGGAVQLQQSPRA